MANAIWDHSFVVGPSGGGKLPWVRQTLRVEVPLYYMGGCQNCGPFLGPQYSTALLFRGHKRKP